MNSRKARNRSICFICFRRTNFRKVSRIFATSATWRTISTAGRRASDVFRNMLDTRELAYDQRLPKVEASLASADLDGMVERKLQFDARLNSIETNRDALALANKREFELWGEITALERSPAANADIPEAEEVRDKIKLLKGVLQWGLERNSSRACRRFGVISGRPARLW